MKKIILLLLLIFLIFPVSAINITLEKTPVREAIVNGLDSPAVFNLNITNDGLSDKFSFYNLLGFTMEPSEKITIYNKETKNIELKIYPREGLNVKNYYTFSFFIRGEDDSEISEKVTIKLVDLENAFEIGAEEFDPESSSLKIYIHNKENFDFKDLNVLFKSKFFEKDFVFDLASREKKNFDIELDKKDFAEVMAGFYTLQAKIVTGQEEAEVDGVIKFNEKNILNSEENEFGFFIVTKVIQKINNGNVMQDVNVDIEKNILSRLFTSFNVEPDIVERQGAKVYYSWEKQLNPGETFEVRVKTNWLFPFLIIFLVVIVVVFLKIFTRKDIRIRKRIHFVRAKGGEFALKVSLIINANKYCERVNIIDRLPPLMKVYERFGGERPSRIHDRKIEWDFEKFEKGETRIVSYVIYSKSIGVMGRFALPSAFAIYQVNGKIKESYSNKAFFVAEQKGNVRDEI